MRTRDGRQLTALLLAMTGCTAILGIGEPGGGTSDDGGVPVDASVDAAPPPDADPDGVVTLIVGGSGTGTVTSDPPGIACPGDCEETFATGQQVTLTAEGMFSSVFTGFFGAGCAAGTSLTCTFTVAGDASVRARFFGPNTNHMFVTSVERVPGSFNGVDGADEFCDEQAAAAGMPGSYVAWLPEAGMGKTAANRAHTSIGPGLFTDGWFRPDGLPFVGPGEIELGEILYPPRLDEFGEDVGDDARVVTDTRPDGTRGPSAQCGNWSDETATDMLLAGEPAGGTGRWTTGAGVLGCNQQARIYCFQKGEINAVATPNPMDVIAFVSKGKLMPGAGAGPADALCQQEASDAMLPGFASFALISGQGETAGSTVGAQQRIRFASSLCSIIGGPVARPDGVIVSPDVGAFLAGGAVLPAPINVSADRTQYVDEDVWVGGPDFDTAGQNCANWTDSGLSGLIRPAATTRANATTAASCATPRRVLCIVGPLACE